MKGLLGFVVFAMVLVCVSYADASETVTSQTETTDKAAAVSDVVLIVDRNPKVQELKVYENGALTKTLPVSTGRETFDFNEGNYKVNPYCSFTQTSEEFAASNSLKDPKIFAPTVLREMNVSDTWSSKDAQGNITSKTKMPYSVFFNGGTAFHAIDTSTEYGRSAEAKLGPKSTPANGGSGACVRLKPDDAKYVFDLFATKDEKGEYKKFDPRNKTAGCTPKPGETLHHKCTDPAQWEIYRKKQKVEIKVVDSRPKAEQDAARKACNDVKSAFIADKAKCMSDRLKKQQIQPTVAETPAPRKRDRNIFQRIGDLFRGDDGEEAPRPPKPIVTHASFDLKLALNDLTKEERSKLNEECNRAGHQKIKNGGVHMAAKPTKTTTTQNTTPPKTRVSQTKTDGLWM